jgi:hypothetical protein
MADDKSSEVRGQFEPEFDGICQRGVKDVRQCVLHQDELSGPSQSKTAIEFHVRNSADTYFTPYGTFLPMRISGI